MPLTYVHTCLLFALASVIRSKYLLMRLYLGVALVFNPVSIRCGFLIL